MWGIFGVNDINHPDVYTRRPHYYVLKQLFNFVKPGFKRIDISTSLADTTISAFYDEKSRSIVVTGMNEGSNAQTIECKLQSFPAFSTLRYYFTDASHNFEQGPDITLVKQSFLKSIPAKCVFTFAGKEK